MLRFLIVFYTNQSIRIQWGSSISTIRSVSKGVKQGGVCHLYLLQCILMNICLNYLPPNLYVTLATFVCEALRHADDFTFLAPTLSSLKYMLNICHQFAEAYDVMFNSSRSKVLFAGRSDSRSCVHVLRVEFNGSVIKLVKHDKHLINVIGQNCSIHQIRDCLSAFNSKVNMVKSHFGHID